MFYYTENLKNTIVTLGEILIKETAATPSVEVFHSEHKILIKGSSRLEDPSVFYNGLTEIIEKCLDQFTNRLRIDIYFEYINTSSSKWLFHILKNLQVRFLGKKFITINWYYDDDDEMIQEAGEVFQGILQLPFNLIAVE